MCTVQYVTEEPAELHAQEAVRLHQDGRESYQVLARGVVVQIIGPF